MNVTAVEKSKGHSKSITIKNDSDRLSEDQIDAMIKEAEANKAQDEMIKKKVQARNSLETLCYQAKSQLDDAKLKDKISDEDKKAIADATDKCLRWLEGEPHAELQEIEAKTKELNSVLHPVMQKVYSQEGAQMPRGPDMGGMAPQTNVDVDDVD